MTNQGYPMKDYELKDNLKIKSIELKYSDAMDNTKFSIGDMGITDIVDNSLEYESSVDFIYDLMVGEKLLKSFINCSVIVEYK